MSSIMGLIGSGRLELFALELERLLYLTLFTLASTIINQSAPNLVKIYMTIRSRMGTIMGAIGPEQLELFALEFEKLQYNHFVYTVASTNIKQLVPNLVKIYMTLRSQMSLIKGVIRPEQLELFALEVESSLE